MLILKRPELINNDSEDSVTNFGYAIDCDDFNIILYRLSIVKSGKLKGETHRTAIAYCTSIENVLQRIYQLEVSSQGLDDLVALNERVCATIDVCVTNLGCLNTIRGGL